MRTAVLLVSAALALTLTACGARTVTGTWTGTVTTPGSPRGVPMLLTLIEQDGVLSGTAFVVFMNLDVAGTRDGAAASMSLTGSLLEEPAPLEGTFEKDRFTGTWMGPGATVPAAVALQRR